MVEDSRWTIPVASLVIVVSAVLVLTHGHTHTHKHKQMLLNCVTLATLVGMNNNSTSMKKLMRYGSSFSLLQSVQRNITSSVSAGLARTSPQIRTNRWHTIHVLMYFHWHQWKRRLQMHNSRWPLDRLFALWSWPLWPNINLWARYRDGQSVCPVWWLYFQPFWFYRAKKHTDRQTDRHTHTHTDAANRYTHVTTWVINQQSAMLNTNHNTHIRCDSADNITSASDSGVQQN